MPCRCQSIPGFRKRLQISSEMSRIVKSLLKVNIKEVLFALIILRPVISVISTPSQTIKTFLSMPSLRLNSILMSMLVKSREQTDHLSKYMQATQKALTYKNWTMQPTGSSIKIITKTIIIKRFLIMFGLTNQQMSILQPLGILLFALAIYYFLIINLQFSNLETTSSITVFHLFN